MATLARRPCGSAALARRAPPAGAPAAVSASRCAPRARGCAAAAAAAPAPRRRPLRPAAPRRAAPAAAAPRANTRAGAAPGAAAAAAGAVRPRAPAVRSFDFVVIGSGIAGLSYALKVAPYGKVAVITKDAAAEGCTRYAQGGVCAVLDPLDSVEKHVHDTMVAGAFLNDPKAVDVVCRHGPARVLELARLGAEFTRNADGSLHLTREGGHSNRRIVHAADLTGAEVERALLAAAAATGNVSFFEHHLAVDLVTAEVGGAPHCFGVDVLDTRTNEMARFLSLSTMLASGGAGQVYPSTTNPAVATGDGIAMAYRAGAAVSNMEFVQFHPTALFSAGGGREAGRTFLITEAVRGEGGVLLNARGERFMPSYDDRLELAPRDVVARAIQDQMRTLGSDHVWLDISHKPAAQLLAHFPNIAARCAEDGIDITRDAIPVLPAQHYTCGGVAAGLRGETGVQGLYACGEVACSGLHGANRLASNSLLEGLVFADRAAGPSVAHAEYAARRCGREIAAAAAGADFSGARTPSALPPPVAAWAAGARGVLRGAMWRAAGIVRREADMRAALGEIEALAAEADAARAVHGVSAPLVELQNLATCARLILGCALQRRESRGLHYSPDYPGLDARARPSLVSLRPGAGAPAGAGARGAPPAPGGGGAAGSPKKTGKRAAAPAPAPAPAPAREIVVRSAARDQE
ncbi:MAG: L-aspartate oxidase [Monoraphidium minutum]|nr:MAG: L-aspartate oxidase [Monoraphidium minutum]